jgi:hypothetical protein
VTCCGQGATIAIIEMETRRSGQGASPFYLAGEVGRQLEKGGRLG